MKACTLPQCCPPLCRESNNGGVSLGNLTGRGRIINWAKYQFLTGQDYPGRNIGISLSGQEQEQDLPGEYK